MKVKTVAMMAGLGGSLLMAGTAEAAYVGIEGFMTQTNIVNDGQGNQSGLHDVWQVWVAVDNPLDIVPTAYGNAGNPLSVTTETGMYYQHNFGGLAEPQAALIGAFPMLAFDSFVTIGQLAHTGAEPTPQTTVQGDLAFTGGNTALTAVNGAWFRTPDAVSVNAVAAPTSTGLGVLIAQFTVLPGSRVDGIVNLVVNTDTFVGQTFHLPAPGALALLGLAGLAGRTRRRRA